MLCVQSFGRWYFREAIPFDYMGSTFSRSLQSLANGLTWSAESKHHSKYDAMQLPDYHLLLGKAKQRVEKVLCEENLAALTKERAWEIQATLVVPRPFFLPKREAAHA